MKLSEQSCGKGLIKLQRNSAREELTAPPIHHQVSQNPVKLQANWNRHYAAPTEIYKYLCVVDFRVCVLIFTFVTKCFSIIGFILTSESVLIKSYSQ